MAEGGEGQKTSVGSLVFGKIRGDWRQVAGLFTRHKEYQAVSRESSKDSIYKVNQVLRSFLREVSWDPEASSYTLPGRRANGTGISQFQIVKKRGERYVLKIQTGTNSSDTVSKQIDSRPGSINCEIRRYLPDGKSNEEHRQLKPSYKAQDLIEAQSFYINLLGTLDRVRRVISANPVNKAA